MTRPASDNGTNLNPESTERAASACKHKKKDKDPCAHF